jgi:hypothetical protein
VIVTALTGIVSSGVSTTMSLTAVRAHRINECLPVRVSHAAITLPIAPGPTIAIRAMHDVFRAN